MTDTQMHGRQKTGTYDPDPEASEIPGTATPLALHSQETPPTSDTDETDEPKWSSKR